MQIFRERGVTGWRRKFKLEGKPDFVFPKSGITVFVDGCFWHGCPRCCRMPEANREYWVAKIQRNVERDKRVNAQLRRLGWTGLTVWECENASEEQVESRLRAIG